MFARSFKELTFVTVAASVGLTAYVFVPAVFTNVHPIALISPLTLVVQELQGTAVSFSEYAFSTTPFYLSAGVLFALGMGVYREEDMFTQRPVHLKALDALVSQLHRRRSVAKLSVLFIPFVFVAELLAVAVLFVFPTTATLPVLLVIVALVEETAKSVHVYAGFAHGTFDRSLRMAVVLGALSGAGFFLGEKLTLLAQLVGLPNLTLGRAAFGAAGAVSVHSPVLLAGLFLAPLALHTVTASLSSVGASKGTRTYFAGFLAAVMVHVVYNYAVVSLLG